MKKLFTLLTLGITIAATAQNGKPVIDLKYLPVAGTGATQIWNKNVNLLPTGSPTTSQVWDYSTQFNPATNEIHTIKTYYAEQSDKYKNFVNPSAAPSLSPVRALYPTHVGLLSLPNFSGAPFSDILDSSWQFLRIDTNGVFIVGAYSLNPKYDTSIVYRDPELLVPPFASMQSSDRYDSANYTINKDQLHFGAFIVDVTVTGYVVKNFKAHGWGQLILPSANGPITYNDVLLAQVTQTRNNNIHFRSGGFSDIPQVSTTVEYFFLRNNPFGTSYLMWVQTSGDTLVTNSYYVEPYETSYISGTVFTDSAQATKVTNGVAYLYREGSNFKKNDILATTPLNNLGEYKFDSIPYGNYRVAIRPDTIQYPNNFITYYGDKTEWANASIINTAALAGNSTNNTIHLIHQDTTTGTNEISGKLTSDYYSNARIKGGNAVLAQAKPIAGIGIRACKRPGGSSARQMQTDSTGNFKLTDLSTGDYFLIVDMPGLPSDTCEFTVTSNSKLGFNYVVDSSKIGSFCTNVLTVQKTNFPITTTYLNAIPNPTEATTVLQYNLDSPTPVYISIFNLLGKEVAILQNATQQQGNYSLTINPLTYNLSSGAYIVKLRTNTGVMQLKLIYQ